MQAHLPMRKFVVARLSGECPLRGDWKNFTGCKRSNRRDHGWAFNPVLGPSLPVARNVKASALLTQRLPYPSPSTTVERSVAEVAAMPPSTAASSSPPRTKSAETGCWILATRVTMPSVAQCLTAGAANDAISNRLFRRCSFRVRLSHEFA